MTRRWLLWLPPLAAIYIVSMTPEAPIDSGLDTETYIQQAADIANLDMPSARYPPGWPLVLAVGQTAGLRPQQVSKLAALALVALVIAAARRVDSPEAGAVAGLLCCSSPWIIASSRYAMSDPLAVVLALVGLLAVVAGRPVLVALTAVAGTLVRLMSGVGVLAVGVVGRRHLVAAAVTSIALLGGFQWMAHGSPLSMGYENGGAEWSASYIIDGDRIGDGVWLVDGTPAEASTPAEPKRDWPNVVAYPLVVLGLTYVFMPPLLSLIGLWALWNRRHTRAARYVTWWLVGSLVVVLPYFFQSPRFIAPSMLLLTVFTAVGVVDVLALRHPAQVMIRTVRADG